MVLVKADNKIRGYKKHNEHCSDTELNIFMRYAL